MTNRPLVYIVKDQKPLILNGSDTVRVACRAMWERRVGSCLVVGKNGDLAGIFTGRDAVRLLAKRDDAASLQLARAMTRNPITVTPKSRAIDAMRVMCDGGFRHVPVIEGGRVLGIVSRGDFKGMEFEEFRWREICQGGGSGGNRTLGEIVAKQKPLIMTGEATVSEACQRMWKRKAGSVLVADKKNRLKGIFTGRDAVRVLARLKAPAAARLSKCMTSDPATMPPDFMAIDALRTMNDGGFRHLPIVDRGAILGVVSRTDFSGCEIDQLEEENHLMECLW